MKQVMLFLVVMTLANSALAGGVISGKIGIRLHILPTHGCTKEQCAVDSRQTLADMQRGKRISDFNASRRGNVITVEF